MPNPSNASDLANQHEHRSFWRTALAWHGSITPIVLPRIAFTMAYSALITWIISQGAGFSLSITPFEYSGVVLGLLLVQRVNAGHERWWEARKIWGSIVNQSRNLAIICYQYGPPKLEDRIRLLKWIAIWPYTMKESLRGERDLPEAADLFGGSKDNPLVRADHMPTYVGSMIAHQLNKARHFGMTDFAFLLADKERCQLINAIGACERILKTPMPFVLAVKSRRFIVLFLMLLPFGLYEKINWLTPIVSILVAYPLLSLDQIGIELQNPFSLGNLSHLPIDDICATIERNITNLRKECPLSESSTKGHDYDTRPTSQDQQRPSSD